MTRAAEVRADPAEMLRRVAGEGRRRDLCRVYLGYARGCGTTTAMLAEARRRAARGSDVVVGACQGLLGTPAPGLEAVGPGAKGGTCLDLPAVLARNPEVVCIDDLAAPDIDGQAAVEAVPRLVAAGITVLGTLHVGSLRSGRDALVRVLGRPLAGPVVDDSKLALIDELEVVDLPPRDLVQRIREERVLTPAELAVALQGELRPQVLDLLRETALRLVADLADRDFSAANDSHHEFRGRMVLCLRPRPGLEDRIRGVVAYAATREAGLTLVVVKTGDFTAEERRLLGAYALLADHAGAEFVRLEGRSPARVLAAYIESSDTTEVVLGRGTRARTMPWNTTSTLIRRLAGLDVHILRRDASPNTR